MISIGDIQPSDLAGRQHMFTDEESYCDVCGKNLCGLYGWNYTTQTDRMRRMLSHSRFFACDSCGRAVNSIISGGSIINIQDIRLGDLSGKECSTCEHTGIRCGVCNMLLHGLMSCSYKVESPKTAQIVQSKRLHACAACALKVDAALTPKSVYEGYMTLTPCDRCGLPASPFTVIVVAHEKSRLCGRCTYTLSTFMGRPSQTLPATHHPLAEGDYVKLRGGGVAHSLDMDAYIGRVTRVRTLVDYPEYEYFDTNISDGFLWETSVHEPLPRVGERVRVLHATCSISGLTLSNVYAGTMGTVQTVQTEYDLVMACIKLDSSAKLSWPLKDLELVHSTSNAGFKDEENKFTRCQNGWSLSDNMCPACGCVMVGNTCSKCDCDTLNVRGLIARAAPFRGMLERMLEYSWGSSGEVRRKWYEGLLEEEEGSVEKPSITSGSGEECDVCQRKGYIPTHRFVKLNGHTSYLCQDCWDKLYVWKQDKSKEMV